MTNIPNQILKQLDELITSSTFSLEALDGIKAMRDKLVEAEANYSAQLERNEKLADELRDTRATLVKLREEIARLEAVVASNAHLVEQGRKAIAEADKQQAVAAAYRDAMQIVFKPNTMRETVQSAVPLSVPGNNYPLTVPITTSTEREG